MRQTRGGASVGNSGRIRFSISHLMPFAFILSLLIFITRWIMQHIERSIRILLSSHNQKVETMRRKSFSEIISWYLRYQDLAPYPLRRSAMVFKAQAHPNLGWPASSDRWPLNITNVKDGKVTLCTSDIFTDVQDIARLKLRRRPIQDFFMCSYLWTGCQGWESSWQSQFNSDLCGWYRYNPPQPYISGYFPCYRKMKLGWKFISNFD